MSAYVSIDCDKIAHNVRKLTELCAEHGIEITGITKVFRGSPVLAQVFVENGIRRLGDSRISNMKRYSHLPCEKWLIRMPSISEADEVVQWADVSLNSSIETIAALDSACRRRNCKHKVVLMYDLGDLREGWLDRTEIQHAADYIRNRSALELYGVGTNLTCFSFVHPDHEKLSLLLEVARQIGAEHMISGGNSATLDLMLRGGIPEGVNLLRLGESLLFGRERAHYQYLDGTYNDAFILHAEVIECREKPSMPWGTFGVDSYGCAPSFTDKGLRKRAICAIGRQDCDTETMWSVDPGIEILGASSDHLMLDVTDAATEVRVGDSIDFRLGYFSLLRTFISDDVEKVYLKRP